MLGNSNVVPDLRGLFIRSIDPTHRYDQDNRTIGSIQTDSIKSHNHTHIDSYATENVGWVSIE
jgi:hypothetical protein